MKIPKTLKIKGKTWKIVGLPGLKDMGGQIVMGLCDPASRTIYIDSELKGRALLSTFLHEINHACVYELHVLLDLQIEEVLVEGISDIYADLFTINMKK